MTARQIMEYYSDNTTERGGCGGPVIMAFILLLFLLMGCKTVSDKESYTEMKRMESLVERMDSLMSKSYVVQQDSSWRELVMRQFESIKEKSDTSHTQVVDTAGNVIKETIIINNTREVTSEKDRQEIVGLRHSLEKLDSTVAVQNEYISKMDSLLKESTKEKTIEKKPSWWKSMWQQAKGVFLGMVLGMAILVVVRLKKSL